MRQQVLSPDHAQVVIGKKTLNKGIKGDEFPENGRRLGGDGPSLDEEKPSLKMPGSRLKGSSTYQSKEHKGSKEHKEHKERKEEKDAVKDYNNTSNNNDHSKAVEEEAVEAKAPDVPEATDEEADGHSRRAQDGETVLQWGQRKRPRYREPSGLLKTSIRADRRVVRADKQVAAQPASQSQRGGNSQRPSNGPPAVVETTSGTAKRRADGPSSGAMYSECDHLQLNSGHHLQSGDQEEQHRQQHSGALAPPHSNHHNSSHNSEKAPPSSNSGGTTQYYHHNSSHNSDKALPSSNSGGTTHPVTAAPPSTLRRADGESSLPPEKILAVEKMSLELFEWPKISTSLSRKEKEDDFTAIKGTKLPQRPKRRPKTVEKNVHFISPGTWLCDLTRERYEVREKKAVKKKPRGLKAMGSVDSESE